MKNSKILALFMGSFMIGSCLLSSCNSATANGSPWSATDETSSSQKTDTGSVLDKDPVQNTVTGNQASTYVTADDADVNAMAEAYYKELEENALAAQGIGKEDYLWTIVTVKGENLIDRYEQAGVTESIADYVTDGAGKAYRDDLLKAQDNVKLQIRNYDPSAEFAYSYTLASNGFAAKVKYGDLDKLRSIVGVESISISEQYEVMEESEGTLYSSAASSSAGLIAAEDTSGEEKAGEGTFIAVLDSALDYTHPAFSGDCIDMDNAKISKERIESILSTTDAYYWNYYYNYSSSNPILAVDNVYYNNKVVFQYDYGNKDSSVLPYLTFADSLSHGTHTAGIAVGNAEEDGFKGVAPYAQLAFMKVFYEDTTNVTVYSEDIYIAAAIEDSIILGVDAINMSLGSARGFSVDNTSQNYIYQYCYYADLVGINVEASVGNGFNSAYAGVNGDYPLATNPDYGAINSPATFDSTLAVGSYDGSNLPQFYATVNGSTNVYYTDNESYSFIQTLGTGTYNWAYVSGDGSYADFTAADVKNKIAIVSLSSKLSVDNQMVNAIRAGARAVIYADNAYYSYNTVSVSVSGALPYCSMPLIEAEKISSLGGGTFRLALSQVAYNLMSVYSAWGPTNSLTLKPELVTIGGNVYSSVLSENYYDKCNASSSYSGSSYEYMSGTSMASPKAAAYVARLKKALKDRYSDKSNVEIAKLANQILMSTATQLSDINGVTYSPRYQGAGALNYAAALNTPAYLSVTGSSKTKIELGEDEKKTGVYVLNFNVNNMSEAALSYTLSVETMTQSLCGDGKTVSLIAYILQNCTTDVAISGNGNYNKSTKALTVNAGASVSVAITLRLSDTDKKYIDDNFAYGSYVEGFVKLAATAENGYDLSVPFLAFYGDWEKSALMDNTIYDDEDATIYASRLVGTYNYGNTSIYLGEYQYYDPEGSYTLYINGEEATGIAAEYDADRLSIGSKTGGYYSLYQIYVGLLRNADVLEFFITNAETGELYEYTSVDQVGKASYIESYGDMYPVIEGISYGSTMPNNTYLKVTVRAKLNNAGDTVNVSDEVSFTVAVDSEIPRLYSDSEGIYEGDDGRVYLSANVYDNNLVSSVWLYTYDEDGNSVALDAPLAIDTSKWIRGAKNNILIDITDYLPNCTSTSFGIALEDASMNRGGYRMTIPGYLLSDDDDAAEDQTVVATEITYDQESNLAVYYSTDLNIVTKPANASYTLSIVEPTTEEEKAKYCGKAEIDAERNLVIAKESGYVRVCITSGDIKAYADVYIYVIDGEWVYELITTSWVTRIDPETGKSESLTEFIYNPETQTTKYYMIYAYRGEGSHVVIPSYYTDGSGDHEIVFIGQLSFYACLNMYSVFIPNTIRSIGWAAFQYNTSLTDVIFEEGSQLYTISSMAFEYDYELAHIEIPASVTFIGSRAFNSCTSLKDVTFGAITKAEGASLYTIQFSAFAGTAIEEITLPESLHDFGSAFAGVPLKKLTIPEGVTSGINLSGCTELEEVVLPESTTDIASGAFKECTALKKINLPDNVQTIGASAFYGCTSLTNITIPNGVTSIGANAFASCTRLINVRFGDALTTLGNEVFANDVSLRSVYFAKETNITNWGTDVFGGCYNFSEYNVHPDNQTYMADDGILYRVVDADLGEYELFKVPQYKSVTTLLVRQDVVSIADYAFYDHGELTTVLIPEGGVLTTIGDYAFTGCTGLTLLNLENAVNLTDLGDYSFAYCTALTTVRLPEGLTSVSAGAFYYDVYLEKVTFNSTLTTINAYAFAYCIRLEGTDGNGTLVLPATVTSVNSYAFFYDRLLKKVDMSACTKMQGSYNTGYQFTNCYGLKEVVLPKSMVYISEYMFYGCTALEKINLGDTRVDTIRAYAFGFCEALEDITFPYSLNTLYSYAFCGSGITSAVLPEEMTGQIMGYAFALCSNLKEVSLPLNITSLPAYTFAESGIEEIYIPKNFTSINSAAFYNCYNLTKFIIDEDNANYGATEEGILYTKTYSTTSGTQETTYTLYILPAKVQAKVLTIDEKFTSIPSVFFRGSTGIEKVYIPATVTSIGAGAFYDSKIEEVEFAADSAITFTSENYAIFQDCTELKTVILPQHIEYIPNYMFYGCTSLENVNLPSSVTVIAAYAFTGCSSLQSIDLSHVEQIGGLAFAYCTSLKELNIGSAMTYIDFSNSETAFEGCSALTNITVDKNNMKFKSIDGVLFDKTGTILYLYPAAKEGTEYTVPQGVTKINECAFAFNKNLTRIVLPKTLRTIGNAAFYQTENLHRYVFLGTQAPLLEGVYSSDNSMVLYATFYDYYFNDFGDFYVYAVVPDGATGYDSWIYSYFFYDVYSLKDEPDYQQPTSETIAPVTETKPSEEETTDDYEKKFTAYIAELVQDTDLDELTIGQLNKLLQQFKDDYNAFFDVIEEVPAFGEQFYQGYVSEANSIYLNKTELYAYRWNKLYELDNLVATCLAKNTYNSSYRQTLLALPYSIHNSILDLSDIATIDEYYEYYKAFIEGIPTENGETAFSTYCKEKAAALQAEFDKLDKTLYDEDVYTFISEKFNTYLGQVNSAISTAQVDDAIQAWENVAQNTVKAADRAAFEAEKAAWIEKLHSYSEDDYEYSLWVSIQTYIEKQIGYMDDTYILASIRSIAQFTIGQVEAQTTKLDSRKATAKAKIETIVENYAMYSNLFENEASVLRSIVAQVLSELDGATTVEELQTLTESGFGRIWAYYEYNQKAYTVYRQALEAFASLTGEAKEEAMNALESISYRVASNYSAIQALIDYYCAGENV